MYIWLLAVLQGLHILCGIFWFGAALTADFIVLPVVQSLPRAAQPAFIGALGRRGEKIIVPVAAMTILLGVVRGVAGGVLSSLATPYGVTWILAFIAATSLLLFGVRILTPAANTVLAMPPGPAFDAALPRIRNMTLGELGGFAVILVLMIAMRFGY
jgi:uncharacterized membrane protein